MPAATASAQRFSLASATCCPFGWPAEPSYPVDLPLVAIARSQSEDDVVLTDGTGRSSPQQAEGWCEEEGRHQETVEEELRRRYLEALFADFAPNVKSPLLPLAQRLRSLAAELPSLACFYRSMIMPEFDLASKWRDIVTPYLTVVTGGSTDGQVETVLDAAERAHLDAEIRKKVGQLDKGKMKASNQEPDQQQEKGKDRIRFEKAMPIKDWIDNWTVREAQLQILLVLEVMLTAPPAGSKSPVSEPPESSRKRVHGLKGELRVHFKDATIELERLLESLVDRLAMWQVISSLGDALGDLFAEANTTGGGDKGAEHDLDEVQRFWMDVVEEFYTDALPSLTPSFRPKLFPTSLDDSTEPDSIGSSLLPTPFRSHQKPHSSLLVHTTPNLKDLERKAREKQEKEGLERIEAYAMGSPTMAKLLGKRHRFPSVDMATTEGGIPAADRAPNNRSRLGRREFNMSRKPSKAALNLAAGTEAPGNPPSVVGGAPEAEGKKGVWGQASRRAPSSTVPPAPPAAMPMALTGAAKRKPIQPVKVLVPSTPAVGERRIVDLVRRGSVSDARARH